jgi:recombination associated protein RdgC
MFFRNLTLFRFPSSLDLSDLEQHLSACALKPVGPQELSSRGFVPPMGQHGSALCHAVGDAFWLTVGGEDRLLPGAVVNDLLQKKLADIERKEGRKPGGRTRKRLKEELVAELLPRAFVRPGRTDALLDTALGVIAIDTASRKNAEAVVSEVRRALGSFPALPLNAEVAPRAILTGWLAGDPLPDDLSLGDECELRDPADSGAVVKIQRMELSGEEIGKHLEAGKQVTRLALTLDGHVSFVLGEDLTVRKFKLLDGAVDSLESTDSDDIAAELDARFALMAGEFRRLFTVLEAAFLLSTPDPAP